MSLNLIPKSVFFQGVNWFLLRHITPIVKWKKLANRSLKLSKRQNNKIFFHTYENSKIISVNHKYSSNKDIESSVLTSSMKVTPLLRASYYAVVAKIPPYASLRKVSLLSRQKGTQFLRKYYVSNSYLQEKATKNSCSLQKDALNRINLKTQPPYYYHIA